MMDPWQAWAWPWLTTMDIYRRALEPGREEAAAPREAEWTTPNRVTLEQRDGGRTLEVVLRQLQQGLASIKKARDINMLEQILIAKVCQLSRNLLYGVSTAAPSSRPSRKSASASLAASSG